MWDWISCNLLGRHQQVVAADHASLHLRCLRCGHRTAGWLLVEPRTGFQTARLWQQPVAQLARRQPS